ncbi:MAG: hypothetical protein RBU30_25810, partial [Polyangia bacterium]|nr:hypothetical protein [Polyangia bacterium]
MTTTILTALVLSLQAQSAPVPKATSSGIHAQPLAQSADLFDELDLRYHRGEIDVHRLHLLRVTALRFPERLPRDLMALPIARARRSGTRYLAEAFRHVARTGDFGGELHELLQPPDNLTYVIESTAWPISVSYSSTAQASYAQSVLTSAEQAYSVQIEDFGFPLPAIEPGYSPYRFYVESAGQGVAGYTAPYDLDPSVPHASCYSYIVIDPNLGGGVGTTVAHEINHSMQATLDCIELTTFWENTAVFIEALTDPSYQGEMYVFVPYFQATPWRPLDYFASGSGYPYGGVLWLYYLADRLAPEDGGIFAREIWEACMQTGAYDNEPDYFDAIETVAAARGSTVTDIETLYEDFAEARYFVGANDDGLHMTGAADFYSSEPAISRSHSLEDLPVMEGEPPAAERPAPYGSSFVEVDLGGDATRPMTVSMDGDTATRWAARALLLGGGKATESHPLAMNEDRTRGSVLVDPAGFDRLVLVVANLGSPTHDPDDQIWTGASYYYNLEPVRDPPVIRAIYPGAVLRGQQNLHMRLEGEGFVWGDLFRLQFSDPALTIVSVDTLSASSVSFTLTVPGMTMLG